MKQHWGRIKNRFLCFLADNYVLFFYILTVTAKLTVFNLLIELRYPEYLLIKSGIFCLLTTLLIFTPLLFLRKKKIFIASIVNFFITFLLVADYTYYLYFQSLPTFGLVNTIGETAGVVPAIIKLLSIKEVILFSDIILVIIFHLIAGKKISLFKKSCDLAKHRILEYGATIAVVFFALTILVIWEPYGRFLPTAINSVYDNRLSAENYGIIGAHVLDFYRYTSQSRKKISENEKREIINWARENKPDTPLNQMTATAKGHDVILIQVESLGDFIIQKKINGQEITPNLNRFSRDVYYFRNHTSTIGAGLTSDSDFSVNSSYLPLKNAAIFVKYGKDNFTSLAETLKENGYKTTALHAYNRNFWNRNVVFKSLGYDNFLAAENFVRGEKINMGLNDGDFLEGVNQEISNQKGLNFNYIITLSSHFPFHIDKKFQRIEVPEDYPELARGYFRNINYTDRMLGDFLNKLKKEGKYNNSLIIVYGDHNPKIENLTYGDLVYQNNLTGDNRVPLFIKLPDQTKGYIKSEPTSHLDIMPTILDLVGSKKQPIMFGESLFAPHRACWGLRNPDNSQACDKRLEEQKTIAGKIIKYNLFNEIKF